MYAKSGSQRMFECDERIMVKSKEQRTQTQKKNCQPAHKIHVKLAR